MFNSDIKRAFQDFGKNIHSVALMLALVIPFPFLFIIALIFILKALKIIKNVNENLKDQYLFEFRSKFISAFTFWFFGFLAFAVFISFFILALMYPLLFNPWYILLVAVLIIIILFGGSVSMMRAWENLRAYFDENRDNFPDFIWIEAIKGCENLRIGSKLYLFSIFIVPLVIGYIFQIKGYFKLAKLDKLYQFA